MLDKFYKTPQRSAYLVLLFLAIISIVYNMFLPLHGDEAYYWMWSHKLQTSYYDHPAMIAYMIYLSNFISQDEWGVRLVNVFSLSITSLYIYKLTAEISDNKTALNALLISSSVILVQSGYIITTPDTPLLLFWTLSLYYGYMALFYGKRKDFVLTGVFLGFTMISKYSAILLVFSFLIFVLLKRRDLFTNPLTYLLIGISLLIVSPMLYWNYQHDWISFLFQIDHGSADGFRVNLGDAIAFIAGQFILFSPIFTWILFYYMFKEKLAYKDDKIFFIILTTVVTLLFFIYKGLFKPMGLNYTAPAYVGAAIFVSYIITKYDLQKQLKVGLIIAIIFSLTGRIAMLFYLDKVQERMYASDRIVERFSQHIQDGDKLYGAHLTTAAYIKYYLPDHPDTDVAIDSRYSHYDMVRDEKEWHKDGLVLCRNNKREAELKKYYKSVELIDTYVVIPRIRIFYTYRVSNPKQIEKK